jgi:hypothetical protein
MPETALPTNRTCTPDRPQVCLARPGTAPRDDRCRADAASRPHWNIQGSAAVAQVIFKTQTIYEKGVVAMSRLVKVIRSHHEISRTRRELNRAISNAATPSMRDELILVAQRAGNVL